MTEAQGRAETPASVEEWLNTRASWLRAAAQELVSSGRLPNEQALEALADHCLAEATGTLAAPHAPLVPGVIQAIAAGPKLRIARVSQIRGVNALGARAELDLPGDLTVVYGPNGAGKSGYARLIKHICGAKAAEPIHGNVFSDEKEPIAATVSCRLSGIKDGAPFVEEVEHTWRASQGALRPLASVHVFDSATAIHFGQAASTATHLPRAMRFVNFLIAISDQVVGRLRQRSQALVSTLPTVPPELVGTQAAIFHQGLTAATTIQVINDACEFNEAQLAERVALEAGLAQTDPAKAHAKAIADLQQVTDLSTRMAAWASSFGDSLAKALGDARIEAAAARQAAVDYARDFFAGIPLPGVGQATWQRLWTAAVVYAQTAYPGHAHPNIDDGALCVLCQQPLKPDAKQRMVDFAAYVGNELQTQATVAEKALEDLIATIPETPTAGYWPSIAAASGMTIEAATLLGLQVEQRLAGC